MAFEIIGKCHGIRIQEKQYLHAYAKKMKTCIFFTVSISQLAANNLQWSCDSRVVLAKSNGEFYLYERADGIKLTTQGTKRTRLYAKLRLRGEDIRDGDMFLGRVETVCKKQMIHLFYNRIEMK